MNEPRPLRGEVWTVFFGVEPLPGEPGFFRPAVVLQNNDLSVLRTRLVVAIYSNPEYSKYRGNISLPRGEGGIRRDSVVLGHQIFALSTGRFRERLGRLSDAKLAEMQNAVVSCLGIDV